MEHCDWSVGQCVQTSNEASAVLFTYGFRKFISHVNMLTLKNFEINFHCEGALRNV